MRGLHDIVFFLLQKSVTRTEAERLAISIAFFFAGVEYMLDLSTEETLNMLEMTGEVVDMMLELFGEEAMQLLEMFGEEETKLLEAGEMTKTVDGEPVDPAGARLPIDPLITEGPAPSVALVEQLSSGYRGSRSRPNNSPYLVFLRGSAT